MEDNVFKHHIQPITISADLGREEIYELGRNRPYFQFVQFPVEIIWGPDIELSDDKWAYDCKCMELIINV